MCVHVSSSTYNAASSKIHKNNEIKIETHRNIQYRSRRTCNIHLSAAKEKPYNISIPKYSFYAFDILKRQLLLHPYCWLEHCFFQGVFFLLVLSSFFVWLAMFVFCLFTPHSNSFQHVVCCIEDLTVIHVHVIE